MTTLSNLQHRSMIRFSQSITKKSCKNNQLIYQYIISKRNFAEGEDIVHPKKYRNVFNKRVSRDGKRVFFSVYPFDYNEPWPFPPVYDEKTGRDLNRDDIWGDINIDAPPSSITGKPKRALGHYPWLGRPIVPLNDDYRWIMDDQVGPYPFFRKGRYENNRFFYWHWIGFIGGLAVIYYISDVLWRGEGKYGNFANARDELWYTNRMMGCDISQNFIAKGYYANPTAPITRVREGRDTWRLESPIINYRYETVFIPAGKEDMFEDEDPNYFKLKGYNC